MHREPAQELHSIKGNRLFNCPVTVIFGNEGDFTPRNIQDALIGNSHPMGILPQVFNHMVCPCQRGFTIYHPFGLVCQLYFVIE